MKKNNIKVYAKALAEIALEKKEPKKSTENFLKFLEKIGLQKRAKEIVALAEDIILQKQGKKKIILETARKITASQRKMLMQIADGGDKTEEKINPDLIAGVKIIINESKQFDGSLQKKLQNIL